MKVFGIEFKTKKELQEAYKRLSQDFEDLKEDLDYLQETFPFDLDDVVYEIALKDARGRYTKGKPSFEHSDIMEVAVTEKNYFSLVNRLNRNEVFFDYYDAKAYLESICE